MFKDGDSYLFNPQGLLFNEITASSLLKVDLKGDYKPFRVVLLSALSIFFP